jgi:hypothetical protein
VTGGIGCSGTVNAAAIKWTARPTNASAALVASRQYTFGSFTAAVSMSTPSGAAGDSIDLIVSDTTVAIYGFTLTTSQGFTGWPAQGNTQTSVPISAIGVYNLTCLAASGNWLISFSPGRTPLSVQPSWSVNPVPTRTTGAALSGSYTNDGGAYNWYIATSCANLDVYLMTIATTTAPAGWISLNLLHRAAADAPIININAISGASSAVPFPVATNVDLYNASTVYFTQRLNFYSCGGYLALQIVVNGHTSPSTGYNYAVPWAMASPQALTALTTTCNTAGPTVLTSVSRTVLGSATSQENTLYGSLMLLMTPQ